MITELAVAQSLVHEREQKIVEVDRRRQIEFARTGVMPAQAPNVSILRRFAGSIQSMMPVSIDARRTPELSGDLAA